MTASHPDYLDASRDIDPSKETAVDLSLGTGASITAATLRVGTHVITALVAAAVLAPADADPGLLERIHPKTLVVNNPAQVRNAPEKVFVLDFLDLMPPTLVTRSPDQIHAFRAKHKDIVVKPLYGNGGAKFFRGSD